MIDPDLRGLLERLAHGEADALGPLADYLEERGDARAGEVRAAAVPAAFAFAGTPQPGEAMYRGADGRLAPQEGMVRRVLALFPEGPRWVVSRRTREGLLVGRWPLHLTPATAETAAFRAQALADARPPRHLQPAYEYVATGPHYLNPTGERPS